MIFFTTACNSCFFELFSAEQSGGFLCVAVISVPNGAQRGRDEDGEDSDGEDLLPVLNILD